MKKLYILLIAIFVAGASIAQCTGDRYRKHVFLDYDVTTGINFGSNIDLQGSTVQLLMDVYEPQGDVETARPLMILAHGGNFLGGTTNGADVLPLCENFSKMGYVVASVDYRVGFNNFPIPGPDSVDATETVVRTVHDIRAAIRYFKMDYSTQGNTFGIDTNMIVIGGVSAGAIAAMHTVYLDDISEMPTYIDTTQAGLGGGVEGNSGNPGYFSGNLMGCINIAGAIRDTTWMQPGDPALLSLHGDADGTVPYGTDIISLLGVVDIMEVHGSGSVAPDATAKGIDNCLYTHPGQDHTPHVSNAAYLDTTLTLMRNFMVHLVCGDPMECTYNGDILTVENYKINKDISIYPNPAINEINIDAGDHMITGVRMYNVLGKLVYSSTAPFGHTTVIQRDQFPSGIYMIEINTPEGKGLKKAILR